MEFSLGGFTITSEDIINLYGILSAHYHKDRDTICLGLILLDRFFLDWYTVIKDFTSREIAKHMLSKGEKMTVEDVSKFISFTKGVRRASQAKVFEIFLEDVERKYDSGELKKLVDRLDINEIRHIKNLVMGNRSIYANPIGKLLIDYGKIRPEWLESMKENEDIKAKFYSVGIIDVIMFERKLLDLDTLGRVYGGSDKAQILNQWLEIIDSLRQDISKSVTSVITNLGCQQQAVKKLFDDLRNKVN